MFLVLEHFFCPWPREAEGGVEDTRLEAKDTKKIRGQGQGQPFRGQTLSRAKDRNARGPRPRTKDTSTSALQKKKRSSKNFFRRSPQKNVFQKIFQPLHKILTIQKIVLSSSRGQANFRGLEASRPRPSTSKSVLEAKYVLEDSISVERVCPSERLWAWLRPRVFLCPWPWPRALCPRLHL